MKDQQRVLTEQVATNAVAYVFMRHVYNPPEDGYNEPNYNEWLRVPVRYQELGENRYSIVFPNSRIRFVCDALITGDGRIHKFYHLPESFLYKKVDQSVIDRLDEISWDTTKTRCKDCPSYPWETLLDPELIEMRISEAYGDANAMNRFMLSSDAESYQKDFYEIQRMVMDSVNQPPTPLK